MEKKKSEQEVIAALEANLTRWNTGKPTRDRWKEYVRESRRLIDEMKSGRI